MSGNRKNKSMSVLAVAAIAVGGAILSLCALVIGAVEIDVRYFSCDFSRLAFSAARHSLADISPAPPSYMAMRNAETGISDPNRFQPDNSYEFDWVAEEASYLEIELPYEISLAKIEDLDKVYETIIYEGRTNWEPWTERLRNDYDMALEAAYNQLDSLFEKKN